MGGMGGGIIFNVGRDITIDATTIIDLQPTDEYLRITSAGGGPKIAGIKPTADLLLQDRVFILTNVSGVNIDLGDQEFLTSTPSTADYEDQIGTNSSITMPNLMTVIMHYHIGSQKWYVLGR